MLPARVFVCLLHASMQTVSATVCYSITDCYENVIVVVLRCLVGIAGLVRDIFVMPRWCVLSDEIDDSDSEDDRVDAGSKFSLLLSYNCNFDARAI